MVNAEFKLIPVPSSDYIKNNKPERYIKYIPIYAVGTNQMNGKEEKLRYNRAYTQVLTLTGAIVKRRADHNAGKKRGRVNYIARMRNRWALDGCNQV